MFRHVADQQKLMAKQPDSQVLFFLLEIGVKSVVDWLRESFILISDDNGRPLVSASKDIC